MLQKLVKVYLNLWSFEITIAIHTVQKRIPEYRFIKILCSEKWNKITNKEETGRSRYLIQERIISVWGKLYAKNYKLYISWFEIIFFSPNLAAKMDYLQLL